VLAVLSYRARYSMLLPFVGPPYQLFPISKAPRCGCWGPGYIPNWVTKRIHSGPIGGEILSVCAYRYEMEERGSLFDLILFR
jgi:hypothetical protein